MQGLDVSARRIYRETSMLLHKVLQLITRAGYSNAKLSLTTGEKAA